MRTMVMLGALLGIGSLSTAAWAEDAVKVGRGTYEIKVQITARRPLPMAAVDVQRLAPQSTLTPLRQPLLDRIERAVEKSPF